MNRTYKCRFCDYETSNYDGLVKHEAECYKKEEEKFQQQHKQELDSDIAKLNSLRSEWFEMCKKVKDTYNDEELKNVGYLFTGYNIINKGYNDSIKFLPHNYTLTNEKMDSKSDKKSDDDKKNNQNRKNSYDVNTGKYKSWTINDLEKLMKDWYKS